MATKIIDNPDVMGLKDLTIRNTVFTSPSKKLIDFIITTHLNDLIDLVGDAVSQLDFPIKAVSVGSSPETTLPEDALINALGILDLVEDRSYQQISKAIAGSVPPILRESIGGMMKEYFVKRTNQRIGESGVIEFSPDSTEVEIKAVINELIRTVDPEGLQKAVVGVLNNSVDNFPDGISGDWLDNMLSIAQTLIPTIIIDKIDVLQKLNTTVSGTSAVDISVWELLVDPRWATLRSAVTLPSQSLINESLVNQFVPADSPKEFVNVLLMSTPDEFIDTVIGTLKDSSPTSGVVEKMVKNLADLFNSMYKFTGFGLVALSSDDRLVNPFTIEMREIADIGSDLYGVPEEERWVQYISLDDSVFSIKDITDTHAIFEAKISNVTVRVHFDDIHPRVQMDPPISLSTVPNRDLSLLTGVLTTKKFLDDTVPDEIVFPPDIVGELKIETLSRAPAESQFMDYKAVYQDLFKYLKKIDLLFSN